MSVFLNFLLSLIMTWRKHWHTRRTDNQLTSRLNFRKTDKCKKTKGKPHRSWSHRSARKKCSAFKSSAWTLSSTLDFQFYITFGWMTKKKGSESMTCVSEAVCTRKMPHYLWVLFTMWIKKRLKMQSKHPPKIWIQKCQVMVKRGHFQIWTVNSHWKFTFKSKLQAKRLPHRI